MKQALVGAGWRLVVFMVVCALGIGLLFITFGALRFRAENTYQALFTNVTGLANGDFVRIAGVEVGKVKRITVLPDSAVAVDFSADLSVMLTAGTRAAIRYDNLIGDRYLALEEGAGEVKQLVPGDTIPVDRTQPALDLDALIGGFRPLFRALDPEQVNALSSQLIAALQGQGATIGSFFAQTAALTNTLADRDQLIGQVITNLSTTLGSLGDQSGQFEKAVDSLSELVKTLSNRKTDIAKAVAGGDAAAGSFADLLSQSRQPFAKTVHESDRTATNVLADHEYFDNFLNTLPIPYQALARQALTGAYFSFYLCDVVLKLNGRGGQPLYAKVVGQDTGRCAPK
ncbi:MCE family protein [Mycolicibacter sinensis]|jgi:phospholipid/cholesterol/gamma-HCH transport system substrate-binding protein|uniref:Mammalian cell entry protein n=1 Tax=Mycolicibacter sinensis (strain JDM601) TaxID=875328 RepID=A0A1A2EDP8_MYCSD|nr:MCE family protein [Mycolicibacter sinensis]OBG03277.1 mammalian cell entry protein [Mycolicibacter sinensis]OBG07743.1 mammalian cell entry protein [Mycolicibacter sinensis]